MPSEKDQIQCLLTAKTLCTQSSEPQDSASDPMYGAQQKYKRKVPANPGQSAARDLILESWERCKKTFGKRMTRPQYKVLTDEQLDDLRQKHTLFLRAVHRHLDPLLEQLDDPELAVAISDPNGWLLDVSGSSTCVDHLAKSGFCPGVYAAECKLGTSSLGTAIATAHPAYVEGDEHYFPCFHSYSGTAAPIILPDGKTLGAFAFITTKPNLDERLKPVLYSARIAIQNWCELEQAHQDAVRVYQGFMSQLEYHLIHLDSQNQVSEKRHPIPVTDETQSAMIAVTKEGECSQRELFLGGRTYLVNVGDLWDAQGKNKGRLGLFQDITQRKQMEFRLRNSERLSLLTSLAAGIAHEIRNPLTTARGFLQLFAERVKPGQERQFVDLTISELDRIQQLVKDFMSLAKPEDPHFCRVDLSEVLRATVEFVKPESTLRGVRVLFTPPSTPVWVLADPNQIKQVILNLLQNALHACTPQNSVKVALYGANQKGQRAVIVVTDTGMGIPPDQLERIFQPFYTTKSGGTGLGLFISKRIIEEHQGSIVIHSAVGLGTTVQVELVSVN